MGAVASSFTYALKRAVVGRPFRSDHFRREALPKRLAMPVFASDMLSSVTYAPDEILLALSTSGIVAITISPWIGLAVGIVTLIMVLCFRLTLRAYPAGGDYSVVAQNLGVRPARLVAAALLVDFVLTLSVSMAVFAGFVAQLVPSLRGYTVFVALGGVAVVSLFGLRGWKGTRTLMAVPTYTFIALVFIMLAVGFGRMLAGDLPQAESAAFTLEPLAGVDTAMQGLAAVFIVLRAFSSGSVAVAGIETVAAAAPKFRQPRGRNAGNTLLITGALSATMLVGLMWLASVLGIKYAAEPEAQLFVNGHSVGPDYVQHPVVGQMAEAVFSFSPVLTAVVIVVSALILLVAANTAIEGFPVLASRLARDELLPKQMATRGDRMTFSNGILVLAGASMLIIFITDAQPTKLIELYLVGVFLSFSLGQLAMVRHWTRILRRTVSGPKRTKMLIARVVGFVGVVLGLTVLVVVIITKFVGGVWMALLAMFLLYALMGGIFRHYSAVNRDLSVDPEDTDVRRLPAGTRAVVVVTSINKPALRAVAYARASRPTQLEAITVAVDAEGVEEIQKQWDAMELTVPLTIIGSPFRELIRPIMRHVTTLRRRHPQDLIIVYIPQFIVGRWWESLLHNQTVLRLKSFLAFLPGVVVATVPWRLESFNRSQVVLESAEGDIELSDLRMKK